MLSLLGYRPAKLRFVILEIDGKQSFVSFIVWMGCSFFFYTKGSGFSVHICAFFVTRQLNAKLN